MIMATNQLLQERYEDALFALLMDGFAKDESIKSLNEQQAADDPKQDVSTTLDNRSRQTIIRCFAEQRKRSAKLHRRKFLKSAAAVIALMALLFTTAFAISDEFRASTMNLMITVNEKFTQLSLQGISSSNEETAENNDTIAEHSAYFDGIELTWIPENFTYHSGTYNEVVIFMDDLGQWIIVSKYSGDSTYNVDTENAEMVENVEINNCTGLFILKNGQAHYALANKNDSYFIDVTSSENVPADTVGKVVNGMIIN